MRAARIMLGCQNKVSNSAVATPSYIRYTHCNNSITKMKNEDLADVMVLLAIKVKL